MSTLSTQSVIELASGPLTTEFGEFEVKVLTDGNEECMVAIRGDVAGAPNVLCRIHSSCICSHGFFSTECDCSDQMRKALLKISELGQGIVILLDQEGKSNGASAHIATLQLKREGMSQDEAYKRVGFLTDNRDYRIAAKVIKYLSIESIVLLSSNERKLQHLEANGVIVRQLNARQSEITLLGDSIKNMVESKASGDYVGINAGDSKRKVLVIGDFCLDYRLYIDGADCNILDLPEPELGGTALIAAQALSAYSDLFPILLGGVGNDPESTIIINAINETGLTALIGREPAKRTGTCTLIYSNDRDRIMIKSDRNNANDYSLNHVEQAIALADIGENDVVLLFCHLLLRNDIEHAAKFLDIVSSTGAKVVLDLVPHNMHQSITPEDFAQSLQKTSPSL